MDLQKPGGWIGKGLHGTDKLEGYIRLLREKGVESSHSVIAEALDAIEKRGEDFDRGSLFRVGKILDGYIFLKPYFCLFNLPPVDGHCNRKMITHTF